MKPRPEKAVMKKMWNQKWVAKAFVGMLLITLKFLIMTHGQAAKHFSSFVAWIIIIKNVNMINSIPALSLTTLFDFTSFSSQLFSDIGHNFFIARVGISLFEINTCSYILQRLCWLIFIWLLFWKLHKHVFEFLKN